MNVPYGWLLASMLLGLAAWARAEGMAVNWCEDRTVDDIRICLTRSPYWNAKSFPLENAALQIPGADPVVITFGPGEPGPSQQTGNRHLDDGAGDAAWMESIGFGSDGRRYRLLVSWSYFILSGNPDMRNVYVKSIRDLDSGKDYLDKGGIPWSIRMKAVDTIAEFHKEGASGEIISRWDQGSLSLIGKPAEEFFSALDAPIELLPGGFRQPSSVKRAELGPQRILCDTFPKTVCSFTWTPSTARRVAASRGERGPCLKDFFAQENGITVTCTTKELVLERRKS